MNNMRKMALYTFVVGVVLWLLRTWIDPVIPRGLDLGVGTVLLFIALGLTIYEVRQGMDFFYAFGENWNGGGIMNSGFIAGVANFFLSGLYSGVASALVVAVVLTVVRMVAARTAQSGTND